MLPRGGPSTIFDDFGAVWELGRGDFGGFGCGLGTLLVPFLMCFPFLGCVVALGRSFSSRAAFSRPFLTCC